MIDGIIDDVKDAVRRLNKERSAARSRENAERKQRMVDKEASKLPTRNEAVEVVVRVDDEHGKKTAYLTTLARLDATMERVTKRHPNGEITTCKINKQEK